MLSTLRPPSHEALPWGKPLESKAIPSLDWGPFRAQKPAAGYTEEGLHAQQSEEFSLFSSPPTMLLKTPLLHYATPSSFSYFHFPFISKLEQPPVHCQPSLNLEGQNFQERLDSRLGRFVASPHQDSVDEHPLPFFIELPSPSFSQPLPLSDGLSPRDAFYRTDTTQYRHDEVESPCSSSPPSDNSDEENSFEDRQKKSSSNLSSETPSAKAAFKVFLRQFKKKEKEGGFESAATFAKQQLAVLPLCIHWKICLELADLVKRENMVGEARHWYTQVLQLQPSACQGWLEFAKLEEECGKLQRCRELLMQGLSNCPWSESLLVKALKHEERMGNLKGARALLARLKEEPLDKTWRTVLEGGLMEARAGNIHTAREVFKYLLKHVPWYGPVFNEAFRFEEKYENFKRAASIVEKGLQENPRYGPLWFSALRVYERQILEGKASLEKVRKSVERALEAVPKELVWKVHFEAAQIEERAGQVDRCRKAYAVAATHCPENLRWKIWVAGARTELSINHVEAGRKLLERAVDAAPKKVRAAVLLECSRLEEYLENTDTARAILRKAQKETKHEWRVFLESVLLEIRAGNVDGAIEQAQQALKVHTGTGRLWAVLIHLYQLKGLPNQQVEVFKEALEEVPKSGEVWCEGARIAMRRRDFKAARRYLDFAIQFTPQYGDSFIEYLALELMEHGPEHPTPLLEQQCINADPNYGFLWLQCKVHPLDSAREVLRVAREAMLGRYPPLSTGGGMGLSLSTLSLPSPHPVDSVSIGYSPNMERYRMIYGGEPIKA